MAPTQDLATPHKTVLAVQVSQGGSMTGAQSIVVLAQRLGDLSVQALAAEENSKRIAKSPRS